MSGGRRTRIWGLWICVIVKSCGRTICDFDQETDTDSYYLRFNSYTIVKVIIVDSREDMGVAFRRHRAYSVVAHCNADPLGKDMMVVAASSFAAHTHHCPASFVVESGIDRASRLASSSAAWHVHTSAAYTYLRTLGLACLATLGHWYS